MSYLDKFPAAHRNSANRAYEDGFVDGASEGEGVPEGDRLNAARAIYKAACDALVATTGGKRDIPMDAAQHLQNVAKLLASALDLPDYGSIQSLGETE